MNRRDLMKGIAGIPVIGPVVLRMTMDAPSGVVPTNETVAAMQNPTLPNPVTRAMLRQMWAEMEAVAREEQEGYNPFKMLKSMSPAAKFILYREVEVNRRLDQMVNNALGQRSYHLLKKTAEKIGINHSFIF